MDPEEVIRSNIREIQLSWQDGFWKWLTPLQKEGANGQRNEGPAQLSEPSNQIEERDPVDDCRRMDVCRGWFCPGNHTERRLPVDSYARLR